MTALAVLPPFSASGGGPTKEKRKNTLEDTSKDTWKDKSKDTWKDTLKDTFKDTTNVA